MRAKMLGHAHLIKPTPILIDRARIKYYRYSGFRRPCKFSLKTGCMQFDQSVRVNVAVMRWSCDQNHTSAHIQSSVE